MKCSRNELTALMVKAAVGSGCAVAVADEISRAACSLQVFGFDGVSLLLQSLDALERDPDTGSMKTDENHGNVELPNPDSMFLHVAVARQGPSVFDFLLLQSVTQPSHLALPSIDVPFLLAGLAYNRCAECNGKFELSFSNGSVAQISHTDISLAGEPADADGSARIVLYKEPEPVAHTFDPGAKSTALEVDDSLWKQCAELAALTYVPSTEASRLAGAGAGLTDND